MTNLLLVILKSSNQMNTHQTNLHRITLVHVLMKNNAAEIEESGIKIEIDEKETMVGGVTETVTEAGKTPEI